MEPIGTWNQLGPGTNGDPRPFATSWDSEAFEAETKWSPCLGGPPTSAKDKIDRELRCLIDATVKGDAVEISVCDNGIGVPTSHRKKIFERFVRVESDNRGYSGGHGLGLSFVYEAAQAHNGSIKCIDGFDGGCKFLLRIPKTS